jgi:hypothetical protein
MRNQISQMVDMRLTSRSIKKPRSRPLAERLRLFLVCCLLTNSLLLATAAGQGTSVDEYQLKAAMLYNLTHFVEWPTSAYSNPQSPIELCILGRDPFGSFLTSTVLNQTVNGRSVRILHPQNQETVRGCHILYISSSERKTAVQIFSTLKGASVLTVGEMAQFATHGGMIQFALEDQQVRFDINLDAASQAGLKISSKLLVLAQIVKN